MVDDLLVILSLSHRCRCCSVLSARPLNVKVGDNAAFPQPSLILLHIDSSESSQRNCPQTIIELVSVQMPPSEWEAEQWASGCGDGLYITILFHSKRFRVSLLPPSSPNTIEGPPMNKFDAINDEDIGEVLSVQKEIEHIVLRSRSPNVDSVGAPNSRRCTTLRSSLSTIPDTFSFQMVTSDGKAVLNNTKRTKHSIMMHSV